jgi:NAD(P)-dependent dehydrogenase (short-subunit alcohol dehydrogenase family)
MERNVELMLTHSINQQTPTGISDVIDINLNGTVYFTRLALAYLREKHQFDPSSSAKSITSPKSITLVSSVAGFIETPGAFTYSATKHGVLGLMRALRPYTPSTYGIRINVICKLSLSLLLADFPLDSTSDSSHTAIPSRGP